MYSWQSTASHDFVLQPGNSNMHQSHCPQHIVGRVIQKLTAPPQVAPVSMAAKPTTCWCRVLGSSEQKHLRNFFFHGDYACTNIFWSHHLPLAITVNSQTAKNGRFRVAQPQAPPAETMQIVDWQQQKTHESAPGTKEHNFTLSHYQGWKSRDHDQIQDVSRFIFVLRIKQQW